MAEQTNSLTERLPALGGCVGNAQQVLGCIQGPVLCLAPPANWDRAGTSLTSALCSRWAWEHCVSCALCALCVLWDSPACGKDPWWVIFPLCHSLDPPDVAQLLDLLS